MGIFDWLKGSKKGEDRAESSAKKIKGGREEMTRCSMCGNKSASGSYKRDETVVGVIYWCDACIRSGRAYAVQGIGGGPEDTERNLDYLLPACGDCGFAYMKGDLGGHGGCPECIERKTRSA